MMQSFIQNKKAAYALMALAAIFVTVFFLLNAHWGIGVDYDSLFYLNSAKNLLSGNGLQWFGDGGRLKPLIHFPPLYPIFVALFNLIIPNPVQASTWLGAILFGVNMMLVGLFVYIHTRNPIFALAGMLVVFLSPDLIDAQLWAMSEPLFFTWMLIALNLLILYIHTGQTKTLLGCAVATALACLTRYIGVTIVVTGLAAILIFKPGFTAKIRSALVYGLVSLVLLGAWYVRNLLLTGSLANRSLAYHQITIVALGEGYQTLLSWFFPFSWSYMWKVIYLGLLGLVLLAWLGYYVWKIFFKLPQDENSQLHRKSLVILTLFAVVYVVFLYFSMTYADASTRLDTRILSPLHLTWLLILFLPLGYASNRRIFIGTVLGMLMIVAVFSRARTLWMDFGNNGFGLSGEAWQNSRSVSYIKALVPGALIYSNEAVAFQFLTDHPIYTIPQKFDKVKREDLADFESKLALMRQNLKRDNAYLILFKARKKGVEYPSVEILSEGLTLIKDMDDGLIYQYQP